MIRFLIKERIADKEFNEKRKITLSEIAKNTGVSQNTLSRIVNTYGYNASTDALNKLCNYFDCAISGIAEHIKDVDDIIGSS